MFASLPRAPQGAAAVVIVRKSRLAASAFDPGPAEDSAEPGDQPQAKGPRVFRIDAVRDEPHPGPLETARADAEPLVAAVVPRKQRIGADRRPGPVLRIVPEPGEPVAAAAVAPREQAAALAAMLARIDRILAEIRTASALRFVDDGFADTWHGLSRRAEQLHEQLA